MAEIMGLVRQCQLVPATLQIDGSAGGENQSGDQPQ